MKIKSQNFVILLVSLTMGVFGCVSQAGSRDIFNNIYYKYIGSDNKPISSDLVKVSIISGKDDGHDKNGWYWFKTWDLEPLNTKSAKFRVAIDLVDIKASRILVTDALAEEICQDEQRFPVFLSAYKFPTSTNHLVFETGLPCVHNLNENKACPLVGIFKIHVLAEDGNVYSTEKKMMLCFKNVHGG